MDLWGSSNLFRLWTLDEFFDAHAFISVEIVPFGAGQYAQVGHTRLMLLAYIYTHRYAPMIHRQI